MYTVELVKNGNVVSTIGGFFSYYEAMDYVAMMNGDRTQSSTTYYRVGPKVGV